MVFWVVMYCAVSYMKMEAACPSESLIDITALIRKPRLMLRKAV
jgi:hypothetical protein